MAESTRKHSQKGGYIQTTIGSGWTNPYGVAVDDAGNLYVADFGSYSKDGGVFKETPHGSGYVQSKIGSGWINPDAIAVDRTGNLYVADIGQFAVFRESLSNGEYSQSVVKEILGNGVYWPHGVGVDGSRTVYVADSFTDAVSKWVYAASPSFKFADTVIDTSSDDSPKAATILNVGNSPLSIADLKYPRDFPESASGMSDCADEMLLAPAESCDLTFKFEPRAPLGKSNKLQLKEFIAFHTDSLNHAESEKQIELAGMEVKSFPRVASPVISPDGGTFTGPRDVRITDATPGSTIYFTLDGSTPTTKSFKYYSWATLTLSSNTTFKAIAVAPEFAQSAVSSATFHFK